MSRERFLVDTVFLQALVNTHDSYHQQARAFAPRLARAAEVWVTEAVLVEVGDALSAINRLAAVQIIEQSYHTHNVHVAPMSTYLLDEAVALYQSRSDKDWGLTDCISFVVMRQQGLTDAVTNDKHFAQAGFNRLFI